MSERERRHLEEKGEEYIRDDSEIKRYRGGRKGKKTVLVG